MRTGIRGMVAAAALLFVAVVACGQTTYYVNADCGNDGWTGLSDVCGAPDGPKLTIQAGIDAAVSGDEVVLADGVYGGEGNYNIVFEERVLTVRSARGDPESCVIDCTRPSSRDSWAFRASNVDTGISEFIGLTVINGFGVDWGPGILGWNSDIAVIDCVFRDNDSMARQGSCGLIPGNGTVRVRNGSLLVEGCLFDPNGGERGIESRSGSVHVVDSVFNEAGLSTQYGDSVILERNEFVDCSVFVQFAGTARIFDSVFTNSSIRTDNGPTHIVRCSFTGNASWWPTLTLLSGPVVVSNCVLADGDVQVDYDDPCGFNGRGAAIHCETAYVDIVNSVIANNTAGLADGSFGGSGGALWVDSDSVVSMSDCTVVGNQAYLDSIGGGFGGAVYCAGELSVG